MLYGYLLYLHAFLDGVSAAGSGERTSGPGRRFRRDRVLVAVAAGPVNGSRVFSKLLAVLAVWGLRELLLLLLFLDGGTSRESCVRGRWLLSGSRILGGFHGCPGGHRQRFLPVRPAIHSGTFLVAIPLIIDASEDQHVQDQEDAADAYGDPQSSGRAVVMTRRQSLQQLGIILGIVENRSNVLDKTILTPRGRATGGGRGRARPSRACQRQWRVPFVSNRSCIITRRGIIEEYSSLPLRNATILPA